MSVKSGAQKGTPKKITTAKTPHTEYVLEKYGDDTQRTTSTVQFPPCNKDESKDHLGAIQHTPQLPANPTEAGVIW